MIDHRESNLAILDPLSSILDPCARPLAFDKRGSSALRNVMRVVGLALHPPRRSFFHFALSHPSMIEIPYLQRRRSTVNPKK